MPGLYLKWRHDRFLLYPFRLWFTDYTILPFGSVSSPLCVWELERVCSQTQLCQLWWLMTILDNYMFRPLLAIFMLSLRELSRTLSSLIDNLKMASRGRNMSSNIVIKRLNWQSCVWLHTLSSYYTALCMHPSELPTGSLKYWDANTRRVAAEWS